MAAVDEVVGDGLREVFPIRRRALDSVEAVLEHQDVAELVVPIPRLVQAHVLLSLRLAQEVFKLLSLEM